jgi:hypothetical protein
MELPQPTHSNYTKLITDIETGRIKIPQFQRDFVWPLHRSAALLDSVIKGYPVGTFIFWATRDRLRSIRNLGNIVLPAARDGENISFVLDGQQRLTSLFAAFKGLEITRPSGQIDNFANIYVDLDASESDDIVITDNTDHQEHSFIKLKDLLYGTLVQLANFPTQYHGIEAYDFPIIEVRDVAIDIATEIFTRINVGGKPLSLFEIMVAKTYDEERDFDLSAKFTELLKRLTPLNYETISSATILQLSSLILRKDCKRQTILKIGKDEFIEAWPKAIDGVERAVEYFRNVLRIPVSQLLPYLTLVAPFAYYFYNHPAIPNPVHQKNLEEFFWRAGLVGRYSSSADSKLAQDIGRIDTILKGESPDYEWSIDISPKFMIENGWFNAGRSFVKTILCLYAYQQPLSFNNNGLVNISNYWLKQANSKNYHHFFPKAVLRKSGFAEAKINNIVNITIVDDHLNKSEIGAKPPSIYMRRFQDGNADLANCMKTHLINDLDTFGIWNNDFEAFLLHRAEAISVELQKRITARPVDEKGQLSRSDDVVDDETDQADESSDLD